MRIRTGPDFSNLMYSLWQTAKSWLRSAHCCKKGNQRKIAKFWLRTTEESHNKLFNQRPLNNYVHSDACMYTWIHVCKLENIYVHAKNISARHASHKLATTYVYIHDCTLVCIKLGIFNIKATYTYNVSHIESNAAMLQAGTVTKRREHSWGQSIMRASTSASLLWLTTSVSLLWVFGSK